MAPNYLNRLVYFHLKMTIFVCNLTAFLKMFCSGLFATVRKCRHRTTGVEYAAKYAAKMRYGQDCTTEILHEIALMSLCTTNPRIIHLIDVFDTPTHMILVME